MPTRLKAPSVFVRIRPRAETGGHTSSSLSSPDNYVAKKLHSWTDKTVSITDSHQTIEYAFPNNVVPPEATQDEAYDTLMSHQLKSFLTFEKAYNVLYFAYGQTGTGKTHSIFGPKYSLKQTDDMSQWGIFPRTVDQILNYMQLAKSSGISCILTVAALDFYIGTCVDLLNHRKCIEVDENRVPLGYQERQLDNLETMVSFLGEVQQKRKSFGTLMNESQSNHDDDHDGSSRSHCALILTLRQVNHATKACITNKFTMVDLAGAERPSTTGGERMSGMEAVMEIMRGKESTGATGTLINYELHQLGHEVIKATEQHRKKREYVPMKQLCLPAVQFLGSCFDGSSMLCMLVCLSQASHCGWETWFSLQYGTTLSKLRCPIKPCVVKPLDLLIKKARKALEVAKQELERTPENGTPASKYYPKRKGMAVHAKYQLQWLEKLEQCALVHVI